MTLANEFGGLGTMYEATRSTAWRSGAALVLGGLLLTAPALRGASGLLAQSADQDAQSQQDSAQSARDRDQQQRDREQEARDREQEKRDREQAKRDAEQARLDRMQALYEEGQNHLDDGEYGDAGKKFSELAKMAGPQAEAALYWKAYAENKQGNREAALESVAALKAKYPKSRWLNDANALEIEVRQGSGHPVNPDSQNTDDLKILALQGIMNNDPGRGIPLVENYLKGSASPKEKSKALFLLVQSGSPQAQEMLAKIARGQTNPDLQRRAVEYLGMTGAKGAGKLLGEVYLSTSDEAVKRAVLRSYMMAGDHDGLLAVAKKETNEELKREAIRQLGLVGDRNDLLALYQSDNSTETRKEILQALFLSGDSEHLSQIAVSEKNMELRKAAIRNLGLLGGKSPALQTIYASEADHSVKMEIINAYFISGNATGLVAIARAEKDSELKKAAVSKLALMNSKEGNEFLMELLQK